MTVKMAHRRVDNRHPDRNSHDFMSVMYIFDENKQHESLTFPTWVEKYSDYSHTEHVQAGVHDLSHPGLHTQKTMGIVINKVWSAKMKDPFHLAYYCAFNSIKELSSYVDVIGKFY